jgi:hypothetical protein
MTNTALASVAVDGQLFSQMSVASVIHKTQTLRYVYYIIKYEELDYRTVPNPYQSQSRKEWMPASWLAETPARSPAAESLPPPTCS